MIFDGAPTYYTDVIGRIGEKQNYSNNQVDSEYQNTNHQIYTLHIRALIWSGKEGSRARKKNFSSNTRTRWFIVARLFVATFFSKRSSHWIISFCNLYTCLCPYHVGTLKTCNTLVLALWEFRDGWICCCCCWCFFSLSIFSHSFTFSTLSFSRLTFLCTN